MTTITIQKTRTSEYSAIHVDGHAGFANMGKILYVQLFLY
jgi:hypothetical protein